MSPDSFPPSFSRRDALKGLAAASLLGLFRPGDLSAAIDGARPSGPTVLDYLRTLARPDGGYAFGDQNRSHLTPTFAVIGSYRALGEMPPQREKLATFVRTHHPRELKKLEQERRSFEFQQVQALVWLGDDPADFRERIAGFKVPMTYLKQYERHGYPMFQSELGVVQCHALLGLPLDALVPAFPEYIAARRRENGSFNNTLASDGGDGHVMNTLWGLQAMQTLGMAQEKSAPTVQWFQSCQLPNGGFTFSPRPDFGGVDDIAYTRAAVRGLKLLSAAPKNVEGCISYILSLANGDGGFGDRVGWSSNPLATYCALDALEALGVIGKVATTPRRPRMSRAPLPDGLKIWSIQIEAHGVGSPAEAVTLAEALRIDLWGTKNAKPEWLTRVREVAQQRRVSAQFFTADEEYGTWVNFPGLGTYSHTADIIGPPSGDIGASLVGQAAISWSEFRERRLVPLERGGGRLIWQFGENEELVRMLLDDSVERSGFAAISTFHFGNPDFTNTEPFLQRWRGRIPFVGLQDAHGVEPWWFSDMTTGFRTLFLAPVPTWEHWLTALKKNWVVAVRHDAVSRGETWMHSGSDEVLEFVRQREGEWRWWDNPRIKRPLASVVVLTPNDTLEVGRPANGTSLRVRCAWTNTSQGMPQTPLVELVKMEVDDHVQQPTLVERPRPNGPGVADHYHLLSLADLPAGEHRATVTVRELSSGREEVIRLSFVTT